MRYVLAVWLVLFIVIVAVASPQADADAAIALALASTKVEEPVKPTLPTDPSQPAPSGYQWQSRNGGPWKLVKVLEVASPTPFPEATTQGTTARRVVGQNTSSRGSTGMAVIRIGAGTTGQRGGTDCATG